MTSTITETEATSKAPATRLLDLLAGWAAFVATDEDNQVRDVALSAEEIGELYQVAGSESMAWERLSAEEQEKAVTEFVKERILPRVVRREGVSRTQTEAA